jgi:RNA polymerase sigma factor (sigma-70 family)
MKNEAQEIQKCERLLRHAARRFSSTASIDDLLQVGRIALLEAFRKWEPSISALWTYARLRVMKAMLLEASSEAKAFHMRASDSVLEHEAAHGLDPEESVMLSEILEGMTELTNAERETVRLHLVDDFSLRDIDRRDGLHDCQSRDRFHSACVKIRAHLAEAA